MAHAATITFYRGAAAGIPTLADGEPGWATDTQTLYVGQGGVNYPVTGGGSYSDEQAQDAVGGILTDSSTIDFTYNDGANTITAVVVNASITLAKIANASANSKLLGSGASGSGASYAELTLGTNLSMSGTTLNASGGGGSPAGAGSEVQYRNAGAFGAVSGTSVAGASVSFTDGTNSLVLIASHTVDVTAGNVNVLGTTGNTYRWGAATSSPSTHLTPSITGYYGNDGDALTTPDAWVLVNVNGTDYKLPLYL